ncbi:MAG: TadE/TadG family type IV pilus assembly protein [Terriglobales bacterium]
MVAWWILRCRGGKLNAANVLSDEQGSALIEFAITLPLLVVFVVGIYDFSGAFNQKQKIEQAAQEAAIIAGALPTSDIQSSNPASLQAVVTAVLNSLAAGGVLPNAPCNPYTVASPSGLTWTYTISGCNSAYTINNDLVITINRGCVCAAGPSCTAAPPCASGPPVAVGTSVTLTYPYHWKFNGAIQLLFPGATYAAITQLTESSMVHNQM